MTTVQLLLPILFAIHAAAIAVVYARILPGEPTPLDRWLLFLARWRAAGSWRAWLASPIGGCEKCTAGHIALWGYSIVEPWALEPASIAAHIFAAAWGVLFALPITQAYRWLKNQM